jgi:peroxiredoxin Q/BCP
MSFVTKRVGAVRAVLPRRVCMTVELNKPVPAFVAQSTGGPVSLSDYKGHKLVLYFYPKDATPGCTTQGQNFRDQYPAFKKAGAEILGISRDSLASHERFKAKMAFPFELISDPDETLCNLFGVMKEKKLYGKVSIGIERSTFVIDGKGRLIQAWRGLKVPGHVEEVLKYVQSL